MQTQGKISISLQETRVNQTQSRRGLFFYANVVYTPHFISIQSVALHL